MKPFQCLQKNYFAQKFYFFVTYYKIKMHMTYLFLLFTDYAQTATMQLQTEVVKT